MVGFQGTTPSKEIRDLVLRHHIGGVILFSHNIKTPTQCAELTKELQDLSASAPLLIAVDQEGGRVARLPPPWTQFPSARTVGQGNSVSMTYRCAEAMAKELLAVGINMNFAPVLDVDTCRENPIIGDRSFGESPTLVAEHGLAVISGLQDQRVIACGKHFPGHGDTNADSHKTLPHVNHTANRLTELELKPFMHAVDNRVASLMTAHVLYTHLDKKRPATLSKDIITQLLRKTLHFEGVVVTDDLEMKGITEHFTVAEAAVKSVSAGSDLVLVCHSADQQMLALESLVHAVEDGTIKEERLNESLDRLLRLKVHFLLPRTSPHQNEIKAVVGCDAHSALVEELKEKAAASSRS